MNETQKLNFRAISEILESLKPYKIKRILLLSPNFSDYIFWKLRFPNVEFTISTREDWDLELGIQSSPFRKYLNSQNSDVKTKLFDLTIAQNVFMYLQRPLEVTRDISLISDYLFIQDVKYRKRSSKSDGLGSDADLSRYSIGNFNSCNNAQYGRYF
jgi:hypothetical protein